MPPRVKSRGVCYPLLLLLSLRSSFFSHSSTPYRTTLCLVAILLFRIAILDSLSPQTLAARKLAVFIYGIETPPFCIFIILPQLEAGFCAYYVVGRALPSPSFFPSFWTLAKRYLSFRRKKGRLRGRGQEEAGRPTKILCNTRDCSVFQFDFFQPKRKPRV